MNTGQIEEALQKGTYDERLQDIYVDESLISYERNRYAEALRKFRSFFGEGEAELFSAPGRTEICGNHTDHQHGEVLAASINKDAIAVVRKTAEPIVKIVSEGYGKEIAIDIRDTEKRPEEEGTTEALLRGILAKTKENGWQTGGFQAYITSDVLIGAGLSSSAALETLIGTVLSHLYNDGRITAVEIAMLGQYAENQYFGKPCGLMDQMACSVGSLVHIDFADPENPQTESLFMDLHAHGCSLCITDTKGSHADLTPDYAAIPAEMKRAAACFGQEVLGALTPAEVLEKLPLIRKEAGDRAALRALHYACENARVRETVKALKEGCFAEFLCLVRESGDSSYKYLQNVYTCHDTEHQNVSVALAVSEMLLGKNGACRVHGGGFAGTIQAFVPEDMVEKYRTEMDRIFGKNFCSVLQIRKYGGIKVL